MSDEADARAFTLLKQAVEKAQISLANTKYFQPFLMLLTDDGKVEVYENEIKDSTQSYEDLEEQLKVRLTSKDIDIMILAVDTVMPEQLSQGISSGIRLHLEEKSQVHKKIGARFLYVPYALCQVDEGEMFVKLYAPIPVGFPAEYIV